MDSTDEKLDDNNQKAIQGEKKGIIAPFLVLCHFPWFCMWWMIIPITLIGPFMDAFLQQENRYAYFINSGTLYYSVITLLFSFVVTNALDIIFEKIHDDGELPFIVYQLVSILVAFFCIILLIFIYIFKRENAILQIVITIVGYCFAFYLYCVSCMPRVKKELNEHSWSYDKQRKEHASKVQQGSKKTSDGLNLGGKKDE